MFSFFRKKAEVLGHWIAFADGFQMSSLEFYESVQKEMDLRQIPGLKMDKVDFAEGGLLSDKRVYLRMVRERLVFDICAAPFGASFFFSCRTATIPAIIQLWQLAILFGSLFVILLLVMHVIGFFLGPCLLLVALAFIVYGCRNAVALGMRDLDTTLLQSPVFGPIYENWLRKETYYRYDTRLMYLGTVPEIVKKQADEATSAKGIKLERQFELPVILGDLYKPVKPRLPPDKSG